MRQATKKISLELREKIWKVIRGLQTFTVPEIETLLVNTNERTVWNYIDILKRAGYLREEGKRKVAHTGVHQKVYRLIKNTGPACPRMELCLYDPNTNIATRISQDIKKEKSQCESVAKGNKNVD